MYSDDGIMRSERLDDAYGGARGFSDDWYDPYARPDSEQEHGMGDASQHHGRKLLAVDRVHSPTHAKTHVRKTHHHRSPRPPATTARLGDAHVRPHPRAVAATHVASDAPAPHLRSTAHAARMVSASTTPSATTTTRTTTTTSATATQTNTSSTTTSVTTTEAVFNWTVAFWAVSRVGAVRNVSVLDIPNRTLDGGKTNGGTKGTSAEEDTEEQDEIASSRFQDNSELQYSLRSIEKVSAHPARRRALSSVF